MKFGHSTDQSISGNVLDGDNKQRALPADVLEALGKGRFSNIEYISSGATSSVFKAFDNVLDKTIAIKLLADSNSERIIKFQSEAKTASKLDHANLVKILNFGVTAKNHAFLIMDFVEGRSLEEIVQGKGALPIDTAIPLIMQICDGMIHSHSKRIAHRDLKTSNIIVQRFGSAEMKAIIVDFGLARDRQDSQGKTTQAVSSGKVKGSPMYISPEQASARPGDERSDIYSLGCILFRILTGGFPFQADDLFDLLRKHISAPPPRLKEAAPHLTFTQPLEMVVRRMLEKNPDDRYQTMQDVKDALAEVERLAELENQPAKPGTRNTQFRASKKPRWLLPAAALALALLVIPLAGWSLWQYGQSQTKARVNKIVENRQSKLDKLFRLERGHFLYHLDALTLVPINSSTLTDDDLISLEGTTLPTSNISLSYTKISGSGLRYLRNIPALVLELNYTNLDEAGYKTLATLQNLHGLGMVKTAINSQRLAHLSNLAQIRELNFDYCVDFDDECMKIISQFPLIEGLVCRDTPKVTDTGLAALARCRYLKILQLDGSQITDRSLAKILVLNNLVDIRVNRCKQVTGKVLKKIAERFPKLKCIGFGLTKTTALELDCLSKCPDLEYIELPGIPIGDEQIKLFSRLKKLKWLYLSDVLCSDQALTYLYPLKGLVKLVWWSIPNVSSQGFAELQRQLPNTEIYTPGHSQKLQEEMSDVIEMFNQKDEISD